jgi:hypothetical protein
LVVNNLLFGDGRFSEVEAPFVEAR